MGCVESGRTYGSEVSEWTWTSHPPISRCYYDAGLLVNDDDTLYVAYGNPGISVAQLAPDGLSEVRSQEVHRVPGETVEGARFYKIDGFYYILVTRPADAEYVLKSNNPFGPYERRTLVS